MFDMIFAFYSDSAPDLGLHSNLVRFQAKDGEPIDLPVELERKLLSAENLLVLCQAGQSRSASLAVRLRLLAKGVAPLDHDGITKEIRRVRSALTPFPGADSRFEPALTTLHSLLREWVARQDLLEILGELKIDYIDD